MHLIECETMNKSKSVIMTGGLKGIIHRKTLTLYANLIRAIMLFWIKCFIIERIDEIVYQK